MNVFDTMARAVDLADTVDVDRVAWDEPYKTAVLDFIRDRQAMHLRPRLARTPTFPAAMQRMMARLGVSAVAAWQTAAPDMRDAARTCDQCPQAAACTDALPDPLTACPNHARLGEMAALQMLRKEVA